MPDDALIGVKPEIAAKAHVTAATLPGHVRGGARDPDGFWAARRGASPG